MTITIQKQSYHSKFDTTRMFFCGAQKDRIAFFGDGAFPQLGGI